MTGDDKKDATAMEAAFKEGVACYRSGDLARAESLLQEVVAARPDHVDALHVLGAIDAQRNRHQRAAEQFGAVLALVPDHAEAHNNLAAMLRAMGRHEEAVDHYRQALEAKPDYAEAHNNLGVSLQASGDQDAAVASFGAALAIRPDYAEAHNNLGVALNAAERHHEAVENYRKAVAIRPDYAAAHSNLGNALQALGRHLSALASYRAALAAKPDYAEAHWHLGQCLLALEEFEAGWRECEWRWRAVNAPVIRQGFTAPLWDGAALGGRTILLHAEQGIGDIVQFCRYVPVVAAAHPEATVLFELDPRLVGLARQAFGPRVAVHPFQDPAGGNLPPFDAHAPLMSLPHILGTTPDTIPADIPYLTPVAPRLPPARADDRFVVGLSWYSRNAQTGARRSIPLADLAPLATVPGTRFVSLQYGDTAAERQAAANRAGFVVDAEAGVDFMPDLPALASHLAACDLVISIDNTTVHMAGALGRPVWTLLPTAADWRWMLDRADTPWYPTMRLFRQTRAGEWGDVIGRVRDSLAAQCGSGRVGR